MDALVLSGGPIESDRFPALDPAIGRKAAIPLLGRPMVEWVVDGLRSFRQIDRIIVVGHASLETRALRELGATVVPERQGLPANLRAGIDAVSGAQHVLALSGDLPLLTPDALGDLIENAPGADIVFPYVAREDVLRDFPDRDWIFCRTPQGEFTGCSAALFRPRAVLANWPWVEAVLHARRRSPLGLAAMIGPSIALRCLLGRLRVADVEQRLSSLLHLTGRGYRSRFAELAMDVDKAADLPRVEQFLRQRERSLQPG